MMRHCLMPFRRSSIAGMRDKLIHHYDAVDLDEVWSTVTLDIPKLLSMIERLTPKADN